MAVFAHKTDCPQLLMEEALCICEKPRYVKAFLIGAPLAVAEHLAGFLTGSESLNADAWHLVGDIIHDLLAICIITLVARMPRHEHHFRALGGYAQALLLLLSAFVIFYQIFGIGANPDANGWVMLSVGVVATVGDWWRFRALHQDGNPVALMKAIGTAFMRGSVERTTFIGEIFHILTDVGVSIFVALSGLVVLATGITEIDEWASVTIALLLIIGALIVTSFAHRHHTHKH